MRVHIVGFGSQGSAWCACLQSSGFEVAVYLASRLSPSFKRAADAGYEVHTTAELAAALERDTAETALVAMLVPDHLIGDIYRDHIAMATRPVTLVLAHGYAVYASDLAKLAPGHQPALLAPKAIGPKLASAFRDAHAAKSTHTLVAAFRAPEGQTALLTALARGLGFASDRLVTATFDQETIGDLISEQTLLCGGIFNLIDWTIEAMREAGVPDALIREECITELELIAGLVRERGAAATLDRISQAAQCGTILMRDRLVKAGVPEAVRLQAATVLDRSFAKDMKDGRWREQLAELRGRLANFDKASPSKERP